MATHDAQRTLEAVWRIEAARIVAGLARIVRDVGLAEELAQDALVAALEEWPRRGVPDNPPAWLRTAARNRALDHLRQRARHEAKRTELARAREHEEERFVEALDAALDDEFGDDVLRLVFTTCHPALAPEGRVALTLRALCGLSTEEIARAFLTSEATVAQRIVRAKRALAERRVPFEVPRGPEITGRLASVLEVVYLVFNEGYSPTAGDAWVRPGLCDEALRLGRVLAARLRDEPEVHGLVALMELQASRLRARVGPGGEPVLLLDQDRARWDRLLIGRGLAALGRVDELAARGAALGPYALQAALAACHARARTADDTDWERIAALYALLARVAPSPVVELNRAVAVGRAEGPAAGLALVDALASEPTLARYHLLPSVRADLLARLGRTAEARTELVRAAGLTLNERERALLLQRAASLAGASVAGDGGPASGGEPGGGGAGP